MSEHLDSCLVVGGGIIAAGAVAPLVAAGARVTVVSPRLAPALLEVAREGRLCWWPREYAAGDVSGFARVVAATGDAAVNGRVLAEARERGVPITLARAGPIGVDR
ncbi:MAG TPA: NAD(P)-dependent oxidoreductase [Candidatus Deferrimicrobiaceae bacterium]|nr:NAD(P)-dependent oxidoreductase [Candidatus Deferrimicrobiaceae bacterium]